MKKILLTSLIFLCVVNVATAQILDTLRVGGITGGVPPFTFQWYRVPAATTHVTAADTIEANRAPGDSQRDWYVVPTDEAGSWRFFAVVRSPYCGTYVLSNLSGIRTVTFIEHPNFATGCQNIWGDGTTSNWDIGQVFWGNNTDPEVGSTTVSGTVRGVARTQVWSAPVRTEFCSNRTMAKTTINNRIDCRNNDGNLAGRGGGDYFSWCFVMRYAGLLCPYPWRVPTRYDFEALDTIFAEAFGSPASPHGGAANPAYFGSHASANRWIPEANRPAWTSDTGFYRGDGINQWGGRWVGWAGSPTTEASFYWSSTPSGTTNVFLLFFSPLRIYPQLVGPRSEGYTLRCVR